MRYETLPSSNVLLNTYKIKANSTLLALFKAFEEVNMNRLQDLVPNIHLPVNERQEEESSQPLAADLVNFGTQKRVTPVPFEGDEHFQRRTSRQRENLTTSPVHQPLGDLQPPVVGPHQGPQTLV